MRRGAPPPTLDAMAAWLRRHTTRTDAFVGVALAAVLVTITAVAFRDEGPDPIAYPCCAVAGLAFAVWRRHPVVTFALVAGAITVYGATGQPGGPVYATTFGAAFLLAAQRPIRTWLPWTAGAATALVVS